MSKTNLTNLINSLIFMTYNFLIIPQVIFLINKAIFHPFGH